MAAISPNTPPLAPREGAGQNTKLATVASTPGGKPGDGRGGQSGRRVWFGLVQGCRDGRVANTSDFAAEGEKKYQEREGGGRQGFRPGFGALTP